MTSPRCVYAIPIISSIFSITIAAQDSAEVMAHVEAAKRTAGAEWAFAARFFCSTEQEVAAMKILPSANAGDVEGQRAEPMRVFDNLYFVGQKATTTWAITTSEGIVLIDSGRPERFDDTLLAGLKRLSLDPARVTAALIAHEHDDHYGGARRLQERFGTKIAMSQPAWEAVAAPPTGRGGAADAPAPTRDITLVDGRPLTFGDTRIIPVAIPGHTAGSMGFIFPVKDRGRTIMAGLFGGTILNPQTRFPAATFKQYLASIEHWGDLTRSHGVEVELMNHPIMDGLFDKLALIRAGKTAPHPLVIGEASYQRFVAVMAECARAQLARRAAS